jgi:UDP-N-acetylmuramyl tripeptide synthase
VIGGRVILAIDPKALGPLAGERSIAIVSGTNGKTTTTRLLTEALSTRGGVVTNDRGANLPSGLVSTLSSADPGVPAVLEVDERYIPIVASVLRPDVLALLNLSRDQLDRFGEVRTLSTGWRDAISKLPSTAVIANADDPLVAWGASSAANVTWVGAGLEWREDAVGCPRCSGPITWDEGTGAPWRCGQCDLTRPDLDVRLEGDELVTPAGDRITLAHALPGRANRANAAMAAAAAAALGVPYATAVAAMRRTNEVAGRYRTVQVDGTTARLLLAKNPAGWHELFSLIAPPPRPVVVAINARIADGRDTSWLWDVPFENLRGRPVVATGERCHDISVRLRYADVDHQVTPDIVDAVRRAGAAEVEVVANYTAFQTMLTELRRAA